MPFARILWTALVLLMLARGLPVFAQKQNNQWRFGGLSALDFNSNPPRASRSATLQTNEGSASIADRFTGQLLFYTDGVTVWDSTNAPWPNGTGLLGGSQLLSSTSAAVIIPRPFTPGQYYIVTIDELSAGNGIRYNRVDMSLNNGRGDIVAGEKNLRLRSTTSEKLHVVPTRDGCGYWLLSHDDPGNSFFAFKVTQAGIDINPVISSVGLTQGNGSGHMKVDRSFSKLAMGNFFESKMELFDFDNATGRVSNPRAWNLGFTGGNSIYGVEFSPDGNLLYVSDLFRVIQYDIRSGNPATILGTAYEVSQGILNYQPAALQLGPDDKIYIAAGPVGLINNPNGLGASCGFQQIVPAFQNISSGYGLPQYVYEPFPAPGVISYADTCLGVQTQFSLAGSAGADSVRWNFGDPSSGSQNTALGGSPSHSFPDPGTYEVTATLYYACAQQTVSRRLTIRGCQTVTGIKVGSDTCVGLTHAFQAVGRSDAPSFFWNFGDPASGTRDTVTIQGGNNPAFPTHTFTAPGRYQVCVRFQEPGGPVQTVCRTFTINQCCVNTILAPDSCQQSPIVFRLSSGDLAGNFRWDFGDPNSGAANTATTAQPSHQFSAPGTYTVRVTAEGPCGSITAELRKRVLQCSPACTVRIASTDSCLRNGTVFRLETEQTVSSVSWNFGDAASGTANLSSLAGPRHFFSDTGRFQVQAFVSLGCGVFDLRLPVRVTDCGTDCRLTAPNIVTANGDAANGSFLPESDCPISEYELRVYDRWGRSRYTTTDTTAAWEPSDGAGLYYYRCTARFANGTRTELKGWVEVLR
ncbi:PKD domain-containing protein [Nostoc sp. NIES-2111]